MQTDRTTPMKERIAKVEEELLKPVGVDGMPVDNGDSLETLAVVRPDSYLIPRPGTPLPECPTNIPMSERQGRALAVNAMCPADTKIRSGVPVVILMRYYLIYPDSVVQRETGEIVQCIRTCILDEQGHCYKTTSPHAPEFIKRCLQAYSQAEWEKGIPIKIAAVQGDQGRTYHDIRIDLEGVK